MGWEQRTGIVRRLRDLDEEFLRASGLHALGTAIRRRPGPYVGSYFAAIALLWITELVESLASVQTMGEGIALLVGIPLLLGICVAVGDDLNLQGRNGGLWGALTFLSSGLVSILWLADRRRTQHREGETQRVTPRQMEPTFTPGLSHHDGGSFLRTLVSHHRMVENGDGTVSAIAIRHVPALVCDVCDEAHYEADVGAALERQLHETAVAPGRAIAMDFAR